MAEVDILFLLTLSLVIGCVVAWLTGRTLAQLWAPFSRVIIYLVPLTAIVRFLDFALFNGVSSSLSIFLIEFSILLVTAALGYRLARVRQMIVQYPWLYERAGFLSWREIETNRDGD